MRKTSVILAFILLLPTIPVYGEDKITINLSFEPTIKKLGEYYIVELPDCVMEGEIGKAVYPSKTVQILIPQHKKVEKIIVKGVLKKLGTNYMIFPQQRPAKIGDSTTHLEINESFYTSGDIYPGKLYDEVAVCYFRGFKILVLKIYPVHYIPKCGEIYYYKDIVIDIKLADGGKENKLYRGLPKDMEEVSKLVINPSYVNTYDLKNLRETYDYVIITNDELQETFQILANYKSNFITTKVVNLTYINNSFIGDDLQEKIRNFIIYAYMNWGIDYVLLGGDDEIIPHRGFYGYVETDPPTVDYDIPADLYYAALDGNWDTNGNGIYGEDGEEDWYAEVYVGRAPVNAPDEAMNFINKVISFETSQKPQSVQLHQSRLSSSNSPDSTAIPEACAQHVPSDYTIDKLYEENEFVSKDKWQNAFSTPHLIIQHAGHGSVNGYYLNYYLGGSVGWTGSDALNLINTFYPIHTSVACYSGAFDYSDCLAEKYILAENGGTVACILNSRYGWYSSIDANAYSGEYMEQLFVELFENGVENLGKILQFAKENFAGEAATYGVYKWCYYELNLLGDPETPALTTRNVSNPSLSFYPTEHDFGYIQHGIYNTTFEIWNDGEGILNWSLNDDYEWLYYEPSNGSSIGEHDIVTVYIDTNNLTEGSYNASIYITSNGGNGTFNIEFTILPPDVLLYEKFDSAVFPPPGWGRNCDNWQKSNTNYAGGDIPEALFYWEGNYTAYTNGRLYTTIPINTTGYTSLVLEFKTYVDHYSGSFYIKVQTSVDAENWNDVWVESISSDYGPSLEIVN